MRSTPTFIALLFVMAAGCASEGPVAMLSNRCPSIARPIPHMSFHARTDSITSYADDEALAQQMVTLNGCDPTPQTRYYGGPRSELDAVCFQTPYGPGSPDAADPYSVPLAPCAADRPESSCRVWSGCDEGVEVAFCTVEAAEQVYGGHLLYTNDTGLNLAALAWSFLKRFWP